jgi:hypothetical protein
MNIVTEQITHLLYGDGKIISQEKNILSIQFSEQYGIKKFLYPDAFEKYLKLFNSDIEMSVLKDLNDKQGEIKAEKLQKQKEYEEEAERKALAKIKLSSPKKKKASSKSTVPKGKGKNASPVSENSDESYE